MTRTNILLTVCTLALLTLFVVALTTPLVGDTLEDVARISKRVNWNS